MAETSRKSTTTDVEMEQKHQHSIQISSPAPPPRQLPPPPPPLPLKSRNHRNLWGIIGERKSNNQQKDKSSHHSIKMPKAPPQAPPLPPKSGPKKPSILYLSEEQRDNYLNICVPLYNAAIKGDWHAAEEIITDCPEVINTSITKRQDTVLHIISSTKHTHFAEKLVKLMAVEDLELQNGLGETALCLAVASNVKMVHILLRRNSGLLRIRKNGDLPFMLAVRYGDKHMVEYIYSKTNIDTEKWYYMDQKRILESCLSLGLFDIALKIFTHCKDDHKIETDILGYLANSPSAFDGTTQSVIRRLLHTILPGSNDNSKVAEIVRLIWGKIVKQKYEDIWKLVSGQSSNEKDEGFLFAAARLGNYKFIRELLKLYPDITWGKDGNKHTIFHIAVIHRHENVYNLLYDLGSKKFAMKDNDGNHILHLAATKPAQSRLNIVSGAALQMQRELLWFKEVQTRVSPADRRQVNNEGKTPQELFTEQHADLMEKGESWMKETASQCMIVAALIATIMFAAAFTLPGGTNDDNGKPIFGKRRAFIVFAVTDAISLCTSSASILVFLAILTARYTENDFLVSIPMKLMVGLVTLFISITTMMIAYGASFFLLYPKSMKWIPVIVTVLAGLPVILFAGLQFRLLFDVINSTFNSRHLFRPKRHMLY
ncbi:uncharacterized protein LOC141692785 [Apium graveolens]|uniref:uncharacterized protein LOC141692785 n=1 Tax=Apium graveolens TaxID=4045 RepID=UPI003D7A90AE